MTKSIPEFNFDLALKAAAERRRLIPSIAAFLNSPDFPTMNVQVRGWAEGRRTHDGWWHPSTHGDWDQRRLFLYLAHPDDALAEQMPAEGIKAVTVGSFWGEFYQHILLRTGHAKAHDNPPGMNAAELGLKNEECRIRGHADGELLDLSEWVDELLELKSINEFQIDKVNSEEVLREKKPGYFTQTQLYLFMRYGIGRGTMRYLIVHPGYPFKETEFTVAADGAYQRELVVLYSETWDMVQAHQRGEDVPLPRPCVGCKPKTLMPQTCPMRTVCPRGEPS